MLTFRDATVDDLTAVIEMYVDDEFGSGRDSAEQPLDDRYLSAFREIDRDPRHRLVVAEQTGEIVGTLQLSYLPQLVVRGGERAQIEGVRIKSDQRGTGLGQQLLEWAVAEASARGCAGVQLTTNAQRVDARRFYERLGFEPSHIGMKLSLEGTTRTSS